MSIAQTLSLIDAHTHLWDSQFDRDRDDVARRMRELGVGAIQVGTDLKTSEAALRLTEGHENFWAAVGQHPTDTKNVFDVAAFEVLAQSQKVVAIGECGLDYYRGDPADRTRQSELFRTHIQLAQRVKKPLMIHCRPTINQDKINSTDAYDDVFRILNEEGGLLANDGGVLHFFVGSQEVARKFLDTGFSFSFSGVITITSMYDDVARFIPLDRVLVEPDAPYAAPLPHRGTRNEPAYVVEVARRLAEIRGTTLDEIAAVTRENAMRIFKLG